MIFGEYDVEFICSICILRKISNQKGEEKEKEKEKENIQIYIYICLVWFGLVWFLLFNGISTLFGGGEILTPLQGEYRVF